MISPSYVDGLELRIKDLEAKNVELEARLVLLDTLYEIQSSLYSDLEKKLAEAELDAVAGYAEVHAKYVDSNTKLQVAVEALESIASFRCGEPVNRFISKDFWIGIGVNKCAESCVADTECAREALAAINGEN